MLDSKINPNLGGKLSSFPRDKLKTDSALLNKFVKIVQQEEKASDFPLPVPDLDYFKRRYNLDPFPYKEIFVVVYELNDEIISFGLVSTNQKNNIKNAFLFVYVIPEYRLNGICKIVVKELVKLLPERIEIVAFSGREDEIAPNYMERSRLLEYFASIAGPAVLKERRSTSDLTLFSPEDVLKKASFLKKSAEDKEYFFVLIEDRPEFDKLPFKELEYIKFIERITNDMPRENSSWGDDEFDKKMFYYQYDVCKKLNRKIWTFVAVHEETKRPAGVTEIFINLHLPEVILQGDTGVHHDFRGNKLGLTLKYMMLKRILTNDVTKNAKYWTTYNAHSNSYMIKINDELHYKEDGVWAEFEISREKLTSYLQKTVSL